MTKLLSILFALADELAKNGKMLVSYILLQFPEMNGYPMLVGALNEFVANPSFQNGIRLAVHLLLAGGAGHRLIKILKLALAKVG